MQFRKRVAYTRSPSTVPRVHSVHQEAIYGTECYIGKKEKDLACAEFLKLPEKRRSPSARKENAIAKSAARNARMTKIVFYLLSSKFFRPKSTKSSKFICPVSVESSKSYRNFATIINRAVKLSILRCAPDTQLGFSRIGTIVPL